MEPIKHKFYKYCVVPKCRNTTVTTPEKIFFSVPKHEKMRKKWFISMNRDLKANATLSNTTALYCCEDHFTLEEDMENYWQHKLNGNVQRLQLRKGAIPHHFNCQKKMVPEQQSDAKRRRLEIIYQAENDMVASSSKTIPSDSDTIHVLDEITLNTDNKCVDNLQVPISSEKSVQVTSRPHYRSKSVSVKPKQVSVSLSPIKIAKRDIATSPIKVLLTKPHLQTSEEGSSVSPVMISTSTSEEYNQSSDTSYLTDEEECESGFKNLMLKGTLCAIERNPRLLLGVPKESYYIVQMLSIKSCVPNVNIFITLRKIRLNESFAVIGLHFGMSASNASRIFSKSVPLLAPHLKQLIVWPEKRKVQLHLPIPFRARYSNVKAIIDCLEISIEKPSNPVNQTLTWSQYKRSNTVKYLISCTPDGLVNFISSGYGGRASDVVIVEDSGFLQKLSSGDAVMADRGFKNISNLLEQRECTLIRPPSVSASTRSTSAEVKESKRIAALRIHVERVISRIREFNMLLPHACVDIHLIPDIDEIITIVCGLINIQDHLIKTQF